MKIGLFIAKDLGDVCLENFIRNKLDIVCVVFMKGQLSENSIDSLNMKKISYLELESFKNNVQNIETYLKDCACEIIISAAFPFILPQSILELVRYGINVHTAALPKYQGFHPISAAILNDERFQGTTVHFMVDNVDSGDIIMQDFIEVFNEDTIATIKKRLIDLSVELLYCAYMQICSNTYRTRKQIGEPTIAPKRSRKDSKISFNNSSRYLHNFIRALADPYPNAFAVSCNTNKIVNIKHSFTSNRSGIIVDKTINGNYILSTKDGVVMVKLDCELEIGDILN